MRCAVPPPPVHDHRGQSIVGAVCHAPAMTENTLRLIRSENPESTSRPPAPTAGPKASDALALARSVAQASCSEQRAHLICAVCGTRSDVILCSFAFAQVHRRVPLCQEHRLPLSQIDELTRTGLERRPRWSGKAGRRVLPPTPASRARFRDPDRTRPMPTGPDGATVTVLKDRNR